MSSIALNFNNVDLTTIDNGDGQLWVTSSDLAKALNYKRSDKVTQIYNRNSDEFTDSMSDTISSPQNPNLRLRVFSLRGCHLIAMFASTDVAKKFRKWVLDVLDAHVASDLNQGYQLGDLQNMRDENRTRYAVGFTVASSGGKVLNSWKHEKHALDSELQVIDNLMQPLLTGFNDTKAVGVVK